MIARLLNLLGHDRRYTSGRCGGISLGNINPDIVAKLARGGFLLIFSVVQRR